MNQNDDLVQRQLAALLELQRVAGAYEINTALAHTPGDAPSVSAMDVQDASEICSDGDGHYDVWRKGTMIWPGLDLGTAANVLITEYLTEKVRRAKRNDKRLRRYSNDELLTHLLKGYQGKTPRYHA